MCDTKCKIGLQVDSEYSALIMAPPARQASGEESSRRDIVET